MKLKVISDGTIHNTAVIDEQGNIIEDVAAINWSAKGGEEPKLIIEFFNVEVEIEGCLKTTYDPQEYLLPFIKWCPNCGVLYSTKQYGSKCPLSHVVPCTLPYD